MISSQPSAVLPRLLERLLQLAMIMSGLAFGRIISDTSFDVSPGKFIITAAIAVCLWIAFFVKLIRGRRDFLVRVR